MNTASQFICTTEDDIVEALASLSPASWPQDEKDLLVLFHCLLDLKSGNPHQPLSSAPVRRSARGGEK